MEIQKTALNAIALKIAVVVLNTILIASGAILPALVTLMENTLVVNQHSHKLVLVNFSPILALLV